MASCKSLYTKRLLAGLPNRRIYRAGGGGWNFPIVLCKTLVFSLPSPSLRSPSQMYNDAFSTAASDRYSGASLLESSKHLSSAQPAAAGNVDAPASPWPSVAPAVGTTLISGVKRPSEALFHQPVMGTENSSGRSEALFSTKSFAKYPRIETASNLGNYPQRPGEKDCAHYVMTGTCKFGASCKFNHSLSVPEGGIPGWKEAPLDCSNGLFPERPAEPDCPYQKCKFGPNCKFNHPKMTTDASLSVVGELNGFQAPSAGQVLGSIEQLGSVANDNELAGGDSRPAKLFVPFTPALLHNSKGLPIRPGETDCAFYLKAGSCKYGAVCRYNHPEIYSTSSQFPAAPGQAIIPPQAATLPLGVLYAANLVANRDQFLSQASIAAGQTLYPQRPGELECDHYMKFGNCKFLERCKFHHPIHRSVPTSYEQNVKLSLAGLPRREGTEACPFYMKTGACKFGVRCKFDHPPPGEAVALATEPENAA